MPRSNKCRGPHRCQYTPLQDLSITLCHPKAPPDGQPIILLADAQTTGGYPCLATVIQADLWKLAQARPGAHLHFVPCSAEDARVALARQVREGQRLRHALRTLTK